jgi:uncharacterized protein (TIGR02594 family)
MKVKVIAKDGLNIRADSNTDAEIFEKVPYGTVLEALDWLFVITPVGNEGWGYAKYLEPIKTSPGPSPVPGKEPSWLMVARKELGVNEEDDPLRIVEYHQATSLKSHDPKTPWCSSFANFCLAKAGITGISGTNSAAAISWLTWGKGVELANAKPGDVCVFSRSGGNHVGFYLSHNSQAVKILSGNVGDEVTIGYQVMQRLKGVRRPA